MAQNSETANVEKEPYKVRHLLREVTARRVSIALNRCHPRTANARQLSHAGFEFGLILEEEWIAKVDDTQSSGGIAEPREAALTDGPARSPRRGSGTHIGS